MIGIGPFIPHPDTPLKTELNPKNFDLALKVMSITRLLLPDINIPATTAMETINPNGRIIALNSGANVVMPNLSPEENRKKYDLYEGKSKGCIETADGLKSLMHEMENINYKILLNERGDYRSNK